MSLTLYHCTLSRSMRVLWALEEMGLDYELVPLKFPPRVHHKDFKLINPLGTVPCFVDGDLVMTESSGIVQFLTEKYGPTDLGVRSDETDYGNYVNWLHRSDSTLTFPQTLYFRYAQLEPVERRVPQVAQDYRTWFLARLRSVESALKERRYLCCDRFTAADICVGYALQFAQDLGIHEAFQPFTKDWWDRITSREAYKKIVKI